MLQKFNCNYVLFLNTIKFINPLMFDLREEEVIIIPTNYIAI